MLASDVPPAVRRHLLACCAFVALAATAGSLYFSEIAGLFPCELCWYQRILMYPLVVVLGVAAYEGYTGAWKMGLPLSALGVVVATQHTLLQAGFLPESADTCGIGCRGVDWQVSVFTIPRLSLIAFLLITAGLVGVAFLDRR